MARKDISSVSVHIWLVFSEGYKYFTVRFLGYGNEENVWEESMMPSKGKEARRLQRHAAGEEVTAEEPVEPDTTAAVEKEPESKVWSLNQF